MTEPTLDAAADGTTTGPALDRPPLGASPASLRVHAEDGAIVVRIQRDLDGEGLRWLDGLLAAGAGGRSVRIELQSASDLSYALLARIATGARDASCPVALSGLTDRQATVLRYLGLP
jgi:hypothetical protein